MTNLGKHEKHRRHSISCGESLLSHLAKMTLTLFGVNDHPRGAWNHRKMVVEINPNIIGRSWAKPFYHPSPIQNFHIPGGAYGTWIETSTWNWGVSHHHWLPRYSLPCLATLKRPWQKEHQQLHECSLRKKDHVLKNPIKQRVENYIFGGCSWGY